MNHPSPQAVVFDLDGLMFNTEDLYDQVGAELLRRRGHTFTPALKQRMMGRPSRIALQIMIDTHELDVSVAELQQETTDLFPGILDAGLRPMPGLPELLDALESLGMHKAIATSSRRDYLLDVLSRFGYENRFNFFLTADDVQNGKPAPEIYVTAADRLGTRPAETLVLEDSEIGCRAAVSAGTIAVAVPGRHSVGHDFSGTRFVADSLHDTRIYRLLGM